MMQFPAASRVDRSAATVDAPSPGSTSSCRNAMLSICSRFLPSDSDAFPLPVSPPTGSHNCNAPLPVRSTQNCCLFDVKGSYGEPTVGHTGLLHPQHRTLSYGDTRRYSREMAAARTLLCGRDIS
eukprot:1221550-Rhodomonas_salina.3